MSSVGAEVSAHDRHFTYGENVGAPDRRFPTAGLRWQRTRMPIVLDLWKEIPIPISPTGAWSTVMTWNVFRGKLEFGGTEYHGKAAEFDKIIGLPPRCVVWRVAAPLSPRQSSPRSPVSSPWHWAGCSRHWGTGP
jgi:hypothetical protein